MRFRVFILLLLFAGTFPSAVIAQDDAVEEGKNKFRGGALRLGAFWVFGIDTSAGVKSQNFPLGIHIDLSRDLGVSDSATVPRLLFSYRFNRRSQLDVDWYRLKRDVYKRLERDISIGPIEIPIGIQVEGVSDISIYKGVYTWLFHDDPKVSLGLSVGLNIIDFDLRITAGPDIPETGVDERAGITAPLPVVGGRLVYRVTPKLGILFTADVLMVKYGDYSGTFQDAYVFADYRLSKRFGLGAGLNVLSLDVDVDGDDRLAKIGHRLTGVVTYVAVYF